MLEPARRRRPPPGTGGLPTLTSEAVMRIFPAFGARQTRATPWPLPGCISSALINADSAALSAGFRHCSVEHLYTRFTYCGLVRQNPAKLEVPGRASPPSTDSYHQPFLPCSGLNSLEAVWASPSAYAIVGSKAVVSEVGVPYLFSMNAILSPAATSSVVSSGIGTVELGRYSQSVPI